MGPQAGGRSSAGRLGRQRCFLWWSELILGKFTVTVDVFVVGLSRFPPLETPVPVTEYSHPVLKSTLLIVSVTVEVVSV